MSFLRLWIFAILLLSVNISVKANDSILLRSQPHWYASLGIGESVDYRAGTGGYLLNFPFNPAPSLLAFTPSYNSSPIYFLGEVGYIWTHPFTSNPNSFFLPFMSLGIQYRHTKPVTLTTVALPENQAAVIIPYRVEQNSALLTWKIDFHQWFNRVMPYLNLGLGASWNHTSQAEPVNSNPGLPDQPLVNTNSKTNTAWNYSLGAGLDFIVATNFWLSLGYSYDNFGQLQLGNIFLTPDPAPPPGINGFFQPISIGNFHAHNIIFTARYLFG
jgi:opacity protein-like surface antigen